MPPVRICCLPPFKPFPLSSVTPSGKRSILRIGRSRPNIFLCLNCPKSRKALLRSPSLIKNYFLVYNDPKMKMLRESDTTPIGLGFRVVRGGSVVVGVSAGDPEPRVVLSTFLPTAAKGDRLSLEPYHVASEMVRGADGRASAEAAAAVAEGRKRQKQLAAKSLDNIVRKLRGGGCEPVVAALLVNRAGWIPDLLAYSLASPKHPPAAEGLAVREVLRFVIGRVRIELAELDEKSLSDIATKTLNMAPAEIDERLKALGVTVGKPWRKEQKFACLSAWVTVNRRLRESPGTEGNPLGTGQ
jgi:hypothetical protein